MTAQQAKEETEKFLFQATEEEYQEIQAKIKQRATEGEFNAYIGPFKHSFTRERLEADGYDIPGSDLWIYWKHPKN